VGCDRNAPLAGGVDGARWGLRWRRGLGEKQRGDEGGDHGVLQCDGESDFNARARETIRLSAGYTGFSSTWSPLAGVAKSFPLVGDGSWFSTDQSKRRSIRTAKALSISVASASPAQRWPSVWMPPPCGIQAFCCRSVAFSQRSGSKRPGSG